MQNTRRSKDKSQAEPAGLRARKAAQMRAGILASAIRLFQKAGYSAATVGDICQVADVSLRTFYNYFDSKQAVLIAFLKEEREQGEAVVAARVAAPIGDPIDYVLGVMFADLRIDDDASTRALWREVLSALILTSVEPASAIEINESRAVYRTHVLSALRRLGALGAMDKAAPVEDLADILYAIATSQFQDHVCHQHKSHRAYRGKVRKLLETVLGPWLAR
ncbi:TetR/AcrR family transcriptional regulator [Dongia sp.]|uniref:TetR/AcrR family transcriptional regulator n=1 Tax=Dongia sp. TaxID=1977262 RepID=UPI0035B42325